MTRPATIYVVDDDVAVRRSIERLLHSEGFRVVTCNSAAEYLALDPERPCCAIVDLQMPGMTGYDLTRALKAARRNDPLILVSGYFDAAPVDGSAPASPIAVLMKPIEDQVLLAAIADALARQ
ncbi:MAG TPA: response regulator [Vicinamibacterales bacterium]